MKQFDSKRPLISLVENSRWRRLTESRSMNAVFIHIAMSFIFVFSFSLQSPATASDGAYQDALLGNPDLTVSISKIRTKEKNGGVQLEFQIEVKNIGDGITGERVTILAAISSKNLPPMVITGLQAGESAQFKYKRYFRRALSGRTILLTVDSENDIPEIDEDNNQTLSMIP